MLHTLYFACTIYFQFVRPYKISVLLYTPDNDVCNSISWDLNYRQLLQLCIVHYSTNNRYLHLINLFIPIDQWFFCENNWSEDFYTEVSLITVLYLWLHPMAVTARTGQHIVHALSLRCPFSHYIFTFTKVVHYTKSVQNMFTTYPNFFFIKFPITCISHCNCTSL